MPAATPALEHLIRATVRLNGGTGVLVLNDSSTVIVTAEHVLPSDGERPVQVWSGNAWTECNVLQREEAPDLAVLSAPPAFDGHGLDLLAERELLPGEELWTCGFPQGWDSKDTPVVCKGMFAGAAEECWANLEASWGNSGGALAVSVADRAVVGGIALGPGGETLGLLKEFRTNMDRMLEGHVGLGEDLARYRKENEEAQTEAEKWRAVLQRGRKDGTIAAATAEEMQRHVDLLEANVQKRLLFQDRMEDRQQLTMSNAAAFALIASFITQHFRTGFVRFAPASAIRQLLGNG